MLSDKIKKVILSVFLGLFCISLAANGWMAYQLSLSLKAYNLQQKDAKVLAFTSMFVEEVLMAKADIDFDTRLSLETSVRSLNNQDIFDQWQRFTKSVTKEDSSNEAKILLDLLVKSISN